MQYFKYIFIILLFVPFVTFGKTGVALNTSDIELEKPLKPGGVYTLNSIRLTNSGDKETTYIMSVAHSSEQEELNPESEWISFDAETITLQPDEARYIPVEIKLPFTTKPGDYRAYLEARVDKEEGIGIAAATKLTFSVEEGNFFQAAISRTLTSIERYKPFSHIVMWVLVAAVPVAIIKRSFEVKIDFKGRRKKHAKAFEMIPRD